MLTMIDMQRELHNFALAEMRNRGIEECARLLERRMNGFDHQYCHERNELALMVRTLRSLKTNASACLSDWWAPDDPGPQPVDLQSLAWYAH